MTVADYYEVVSLKTASLFSASAEASALLSLSSQETSRGLAAFGRLIGLAYQIYDDCADLCSSPESMGKTLGTDLEKGTMTLPLILFIDKNSPTPRTAVLNWLCGPQSAPLEERVQKLRRSGVISDSASSGLKMLSEAESHLKCLPLGTASASLRMIVLHLRRLLEEIRASDQRSNSEPLPSS
jgi:octaprenyl-diphosphate synthase